MADISIERLRSPNVQAQIRDLDEFLTGRIDRFGSDGAVLLEAIDKFDDPMVVVNSDYEILAVSAVLHDGESQAQSVGDRFDNWIHWQDRPAVREALDFAMRGEPSEPEFRSMYGHTYRGCIRVVRNGMWVAIHCRMQEPSESAAPTPPPRQEKAAGASVLRAREMVTLRSGGLFVFGAVFGLVVAFAGHRIIQSQGDVIRKQDEQLNASERFLNSYRTIYNGKVSDSSMPLGHTFPAVSGAAGEAVFHFTAGDDGE